MSKKTDNTKKNIDNTVSGGSEVKDNFVIANQRNSNVLTGFVADDGDITLIGDYLISVSFSAFGAAGAKTYDLQYSTDNGSTWTTLIGHRMYINRANTHYPISFTHKKTDLSIGSINKWKLQSTTITMDENDFFDAVIVEI